MKFLLAAVNAKYIHSNPAIYSLRACAGEALHPYIELAEYTINQRTQDILADIYERKPDVVGFSCYIWNWDIIRELLPELPKVLPETDIWLGGPEVTYDADKILGQFPWLAGIMTGEGEATFKELLQWYIESDGEGAEDPDAQKSKRGLLKIPGLCLSAAYGAENVPLYTPPRELTDLDSLPFLYEDLGLFTNRIIYYESSRGCPYRCSYCLSSIDKKVRFRDIDTVKKELQFFLDHRVKQVKFVDRTFNCSHDHAMQIWEYIYKNDNGVTNFHFEISADILREDEAALLGKFRPGLVQLEIGVQSVNEETLRAVHRVMNLERLEQIVAVLRRGRNIHLHLDLIAGLPFEDYESFGRSFDRVYAMRPEQLQLGFLKVLKGSEMREKAAEYGICFMDRPPYEVLYTKWLSYADILRLKEIEEMVELYYNSGQFAHTIAFLERVFESPFALYEKLAEFCRQGSRLAQSSARASRYERLLAFAGTYDEKHIDLYRELLTYDMYLRENLKSRPVFAAELTAAGKAYAREFFQREERERTYLPGYADYDWKQLSRMTHLEPFHFPVWDSGWTDMRIDRGIYYVLFDYAAEARDPLTHDAATHVIRSDS